MLDLQKLKTNLEKRAESDLSEGNIGACAMIVKEHGKTVYENCFGPEWIGQPRPVTATSLFRLASMTKPITTVAALTMVDEGKLALTDTLEQYLPEFQHLHLRVVNENGVLEDRGEAKNKITIAQLLSHSSGIVGGGMFERMTAEDKKTRDNALAFYAKHGVSFEPGTAQEYSSSAAFDIVVRIVEKLSGEPYDQYIKRKIFEPLGMKDTFYIQTDEEEKRLVAMMDKKDGKAVSTTAEDIRNSFNYAHSVFWGGAALSSTLSDYIRFAEMLRMQGSYEGNTVISKEAVRLMSTVHFTPWGLGVRVIEEPYGTLPKGAFGWSGAYGTHFWVDPVHDLTAVYLKNSHYDGGAGAITALHFEQDVYASIV